MINPADWLTINSLIHYIFRIAIPASILISATSVNAVPQTYIRNYTYQASELDSKITARTATLGQVKHLLLTELGTYVNSTTTIKKSSDGKKFSRLEITELAGGVIQTDIIKETWDGKSYYAELKMIADPEMVAKTLRDQYKLASVGKPIYVAEHDSNDRQSNTLMNKGKKIALLARHDTGTRSYLDSETASEYMLQTLRRVIDSTLQETNLITSISDMGVTQEMLWETKKGEKSKYMCLLFNADYILASILEDHEGQGYLRDINMYIYDCSQNTLARKRFRPDFSDEGKYAREESVRNEFSNFLKYYVKKNS